MSTTLDAAVDAVAREVLSEAHAHVDLLAQLKAGTRDTVQCTRDSERRRREREEHERTGRRGLRAEQETTVLKGHEDSGGHGVLDVLAQGRE